LPDDSTFAFGRVLRRYREQKGWSQLKLAEKADLHINAIGLLERGERSPNLPTIFALCRALDVSASRFMASVEDVSQKRG
jgi:transcriptional regulator with XRE-family HTH domain